MSTSDFTFFEYYSEESIRFNSVCACACMCQHAYWWQCTQEEIKNDYFRVSSPPRWVSKVRLRWPGLVARPLPAEHSTASAHYLLFSNSTQTVSVVQIFQDIHTLFYLRGKISPSLPICFIWNGCSRGFQGKYYSGIPLQREILHLSWVGCSLS